MLLLQIPQTTSSSDWEEVLCQIGPDDLTYFLGYTMCASPYKDIKSLFRGL